MKNRNQLRPSLYTAINYNFRKNLNDVGKCVGVFLLLVFQNNTR